MCIAKEWYYFKIIKGFYLHQKAVNGRTTQGKVAWICHEGSCAYYVFIFAPGDFISSRETVTLPARSLHQPELILEMK